MNKKLNLIIFILYIVAALCLFAMAVLYAISQKTAIAIVFICCGCCLVGFSIVHLARILKTSSPKNEKNNNENIKTDSSQK